MPALSPTMEEGKLAKWVKAEGDEVRSGDVIAEIETDKATMEVEAVDEGKLGKILVPAGTESVKVNTPIAVIVADGEDASALGEWSSRETQRRPQSPPSRNGNERGARHCRCPRPRHSTRSASCWIRQRRRNPRRRGNGADHHARSAARRHGRGNAPRRQCFRHGRGGRGVSRRVQDHARPAR